MARIMYLNPNDEKAIRLLAQGHRFYSLKKHCDIPLSGMGFFTSELRRKTGIRDTKSARECHLYIERYEAAMAANVTPDPMQMLAFKFLLEGGHTHAGMAYQLGIAEEEVPRFLDTTFASIGIFSRCDRTRKTQLRLFMASMQHENANLSPIELSLMDLYAQGLHFLEIAERAKQPEKYVRWVLKGVCLRLGLSSRGKNAQRNLVRAYLEKRATQRESLMDDPAF